MPSSKLQRWVDLLAALLRRKYPVTLEELLADVPGYQGRAFDAYRRTFERDKDELRAFGIPIQTVEQGEGEPAGYRLPAREFYLPYLSVMSEGRASRARRVNRDGYRALAQLAFEPDELEAVVEAARRVQALGDPLLADHARSAIRKLATDLPLDVSLERAPGERGEETILREPAALPEPDVFEALNDALTRRKRVSFRYRSMHADTESTREVEPLGLFFVSQHWYLAARDTGDGGIRNFRVSRISAARVNAATPNTPDFEVPAEFSLREHARSRQAWELGSSDALDAVVDFLSPNGAAQAAARLGSPVEGRDSQRRFQVRRLDAFVRWLLSLGDAVRPLGPPALLAEYERQARETLQLYVAGT